MRVLVTRPSNQAARTAKRLAALGHHAVRAPALEIVPTGVTPPEGEFDLIIATSAHAFARWTAPRALRALPVACVGEKTAQAAEAAGFRAAFAAPHAESLAECLIAKMGVSYALYLAGRERKPVLEARLSAAGWRVAVAETYDARPVAHWPAEVMAALSNGQIDAALHYSPRSASAALVLMGAGAASRLSHFCLSDDVADICAAWAPRERIFTASQPEEESLMKLLAA